MYGQILDSLEHDTGLSRLANYNSIKVSVKLLKVGGGAEGIGLLD